MKRSCCRLRLRGICRTRWRVRGARGNCGETKLNHAVLRSSLATSIQSLICRSLVSCFQENSLFVREKTPEVLQSRLRAGHNGEKVALEKRGGLHFQLNSDLWSQQTETHMSLTSSVSGHLKIDHFGLFYLWGIRTHLSHVGNHRDLQISSDGAEGFTAPAVVKAS